MNVNIHDALNMFSKLSFRRFLNMVKVGSGFFLSQIFRKPVVLGLPVAVSIEPTTSCNLRCPECPSGLRSFTRPTGMLQQSFFKDVIEQLHKDVFYMIFYFQGEPFLNPDFLNMIRHASSKNIYTATSTNAHFLDDETARKTVESGLDRLIISIDGITQEVYRQYRIGGSLEKVLAGTKNIIGWKKKLKSKKPYVVFQFLVVHPNEHQMEDAKKLAEEIGVDDIFFKTAQIYDYKNGSSLIPDADGYSRYRKNNNGEYEIKNKLLNHCWKLWHSSVITWDGKIVPCCFDKDAHYKMGELDQHSFGAIWKGKEYNRFRQSVLKSRKENDICTNCSEGLKVFS
jgi:radical SAM protein with 4Fe4S-binding SPASM domain